MTAAVLTGFEATIALARLALTRLLRGKALWFALGLGLLPSLLALAWRAGNAEVMTVWERSVTSYALVMTIIAPILVASSLSDEIDDRTAAYLWSRAVPRWTVVAGKLLALAPVVAVALVLGLTVSWALLGGPAAVPAEVFARTALGERPHRDRQAELRGAVLPQVLAREREVAGREREPERHRRRRAREPVAA